MCLLVTGNANYTDICLNQLLAFEGGVKRLLFNKYVCIYKT